MTPTPGIYIFGPYHGRPLEHRPFLGPVKIFRHVAGKFSPWDVNPFEPIPYTTYRDKTFTHKGEVFACSIEDGHDEAEYAPQVKEYFRLRDIWAESENLSMEQWTGAERDIRRQKIYRIDLDYLPGEICAKCGTELNAHGFVPNFAPNDHRKHGPYIVCPNAVLVVHQLFGVVDIAMATHIDDVRSKASPIPPSSPA